MSELGNVYTYSGRFKQAEQLEKEALAREQKLFGLENAHTAVCVHNLGVVYQEWRKYPEAKAQFELAVKIKEKVLPPDAPELARSLAALGRICDFTGPAMDQKEAESCLRRALPILKEHNDSNYTYYSDTLAWVLCSKKEFDEAEEVLKDAIEYQSRLASPNDKLLAKTFFNYGNFLCARRNNYSQAKPLFEKTLNILEKQHHSDVPFTAETSRMIAYCQEKGGEYDTALHTYTTALSQFKQIRENLDRESMEYCLLGLSRVLKKLGKTGEAESFAEEAKQYK